MWALAKFFPRTYFGSQDTCCALQILDRGTQTFVRGGACCASQGCVHLSLCPGLCPRRRSLCVEGTQSLRPAVARGATQVVGRGAQAAARGGAPCASRVFGRGAEADNRGAPFFFRRYLIVMPRPMPRRRDAAAARDEKLC
jgi:hypothetical protein